jgi:hypothetical protein
VDLTEGLFWLDEVDGTLQPSVPQLQDYPSLTSFDDFCQSAKTNRNPQKQKSAPLPC